MRLATGLAAEDRRLFSAASIPSSCLRRATIACKARISRSGRGLGTGRTASAKRANIDASIRSVLASFPVALAKSRT
jgi:hypothetical protein